MGIRINKMLGYGLTDLSGKDDPRLNPSGIIFNYDEDRYSEADAYLDWLDEYRSKEVAGERRNMEALIFRQLREPGPRNPHSYLYANSEPRECFAMGTVDDGLTNVLCIRPLGEPSWHRGDDTIDWIEETYVKEPEGENLQQWVKVLDHGIYPYNGLYMNAHTGEQVPSPDARVFFQISPDIGKDDRLTQLLEKLAQRLGFADAADCAANLVPEVPDEVRNLCVWGDAFKNQTVINQLRPMIYCWWR